MVGCLGISNLVNTKIAKFIKYQSHGGVIEPLYVKNAKIGSQKGNSLIKLF